MTRILVRVLMTPWRALQSFRFSMTGASATILIVCIITLNIIWGYPWIGMFSASLSLMVIGFAANRLMRPKLRVGFSLPDCAPAGEAFSVVSHLQNRSPLPAMQLEVGFAEPTRYQAASEAKLGAAFHPVTPNQPMDIIHPHDFADLRLNLRIDRRGVHTLPDLIVTSTFPFCLFRSIQRLPTRTPIAITPRPATDSDDSFTRGMLSALGQWSHRLLAGDALDYTGSREYQTGMPVRRWDFASWARLGRPIVREYQSPSIQAVTLIVDTAVPRGADASSTQWKQGFERLLSITAAAIIELTRKMVRIQLYLTDEDPGLVTGEDHSQQTTIDSESMLIRLAAAERTTVEKSDAHAQTVLQHIGRLPGLVLSLRPDAQTWQDLPANVSLLRFDPAHPLPGDGRSIRPPTQAANPQAANPQAASSPPATAVGG